MDNDHSHLQKLHQQQIFPLHRSVDEAGKVFGIQGLRIADASIMPTVPSGNTFLSTIMLAEKIADAIKSND